MKKLAFILLLIPMYIYCQDTIKKTIVIADYNTHYLMGHDSLGQKQGEWSLVDTSILIIKDRDLREFIENVYESGFYENNKKEGVWEVYDSKDFSKRKLLAHRLYSQNSVLYEVQYHNGVIHAIVSYKIFSRYNNVGNIESQAINDLILFDKKGKIKYREYVTPDGILEKMYY